MLNNPFIINLKELLKGPLPGEPAQFEMAHISREKIKYEDLKKGNYKSSAVLLLLAQRNGEFFIPLTERHTYKGAHSGQVSFPGGKKEEHDETLVHTALRECGEEIGVHKQIEVIGELTPLYIPVSGFLVNPYVGVYTGENLEYQINNLEVKSLLELTLSDLRNPGLIKETVIEPTQGYKIKTPYFDVRGRIVWGATAMILNEFKKLL